MRTFSFSALVFAGMLLGTVPVHAQEEGGVAGAMKLVKDATDFHDCRGTKNQSSEWWSQQFAKESREKGVSYPAVIYLHAQRYCKPRIVGEVSRRLGGLLESAGYAPVQVPLVMPAGSPPVQPYAQLSQAPLSQQQQSQPYPGQQSVLDQGMLSVYLQCLNAGRSQPYTEQQVISILQAQSNQSQPPKSLQEILSEQVAARCSGPVRTPLVSTPPINVNAQGGNVGPVSMGMTQVASPQMAQGQSQAQDQAQTQQQSTFTQMFPTEQTGRRLFFFRGGDIAGLNFRVYWSGCRVSGARCIDVGRDRDAISTDLELVLRPFRPFGVYSGLSLIHPFVDTELTPTEQKSSDGKWKFQFFGMFGYSFFERSPKAPEIVAKIGYGYNFYPANEAGPHMFKTEFNIKPGQKYLWVPTAVIGVDVHTDPARAGKVGGWTNPAYQINVGAMYPLL